MVLDGRQIKHSEVNGSNHSPKTFFILVIAFCVANSRVNCVTLTYILHIIDIGPSQTRNHLNIKSPCKPIDNWDGLVSSLTVVTYRSIANTFVEFQTVAPGGQFWAGMFTFISQISLLFELNTF